MLCCRAGHAEQAATQAFYGDKDGKEGGVDGQLGTEKEDARHSKKLAGTSKKQGVKSGKRKNVEEGDEEEEGVQSEGVVDLVSGLNSAQGSKGGSRQRGGKEDEDEEGGAGDQEGGDILVSVQRIGGRGNGTSTDNNAEEKEGESDESDDGSSQDGDEGSDDGNAGEMPGWG